MVNLEIKPMKDTVTFGRTQHKPIIKCHIWKTSIYLFFDRSSTTLYFRICYLILILFCICGLNISTQLSPRFIRFRHGVCIIIKSDIKKKKLRCWRITDKRMWVWARCEWSLDEFILHYNSISHNFLSSKLYWSYRWWHFVFNQTLGYNAHVIKYTNGI